MQVSENIHEEAYTICVEEYCVPKNYRQSAIPKDNLSGGPVKVTLQFDNLEVLAVNDLDFTVTLRMYLGIHWREPRLVGPNSSSEFMIPLDLKLLEYLWLPDLEILHLKEINDFHILKKLAGTQCCTNE